MQTLKNNRSTTIFDVAEKAEVSIATISRVLNSPEKVKDSTRKKVLSIIDQLGFTPKAEQRARAKKSTGRIGVLTTYFYAPSFIQRLRGIARTLSKSNHEMVIYTADSDKKLENYLSSLPLLGNLDGLVIITHQINDEDANRFIKHKIPVVLIERPHPKLNSIEIDDIDGGQLATNHLISKGHSKIAFLGDMSPDGMPIPAVQQRLQGYRLAMNTANLQIPDHFIQFASSDEDEAQQTIRKFLLSGEQPTAIFASTDNVAIQIIKVSRQLGIKVPSELAVIGFDDIDFARFEDLTTIRQHLDDSGKLAVEILLAQMADNSRPIQHIHLPLEIIERSTT